MESIKEAFQKVKGDINSLNSELNALKQNLSETRVMMIEVCEIIKKLSEKSQEKRFIEKSVTSTDKQQNQTDTIPYPTHNTNLNPLKHQNSPISIGNNGVPTDKQTNRQTDKQIENTPKNPLEDALDIINSLDEVKKEIRLKFKRLTNQELLVFSTLYQLEEEEGYTDYKSISDKLNLSESSIRDYIGRLIKKGIPIEKNKLNNKSIQLSIQKNLKKITTLSTILKLIDL